MRAAPMGVRERLQADGGKHSAQSVAHGREWAECCAMGTVVMDAPIAQLKSGDARRKHVRRVHELAYVAVWLAFLGAVETACGLHHVCRQRHGELWSHRVAW